jgi:RNA polymerase sigma factor (sigma-70 family)
MSDLDAKVHRASQGDHAALQELVVAHLDDLERFIHRRTGDRFLGKDSLSDLVQSSAREALAHLSQHDYRGEYAFKAWLYKIALTKIVARYRHHRAARRDVRREAEGDPQVHLGEVCASFGSPSGVAMQKEFEGRFAAAFDRLSPEHQQVFFLARVLELPHAEIARQMGRSEEASRNLLRRATACLGAELALDDPASSSG